MKLCKDRLQKKNVAINFCDFACVHQQSYSKWMTQRDDAVDDD